MHRPPVLMCSAPRTPSYLSVRHGITTEYFSVLFTTFVQQGALAPATDRARARACTALQRRALGHNRRHAASLPAHFSLAFARSLSRSPHCIAASRPTPPQRVHAYQHGSAGPSIHQRTPMPFEPPLKIRYCAGMARPFFSAARGDGSGRKGKAHVPRGSEEVGGRGRIRRARRISAGSCCVLCTRSPALMSFWANRVTLPGPTLSARRKHVRTRARTCVGSSVHAARGAGAVHAAECKKLRALVPGSHSRARACCFALAL